MEKIIIYTLSTTYIVLSIYVQIRIANTKSFSKKQKLFQSILLWIVPIVSACLLLSFYSVLAAPDKRKKINPNVGNDPSEYI